MAAVQFQFPFPSQQHFLTDSDCLYTYIVPSSAHSLRSPAMSSSRNLLFATSIFAASIVAAPAPQAGPYTLTGQSTTLTYTVSQDTNGNVLATKYFQYPYLPYHADTNTGARGSQTGYNLCNSTTLGANSRCQTAWINSIEDFCVSDRRMQASDRSPSGRPKRACMTFREMLSEIFTVFHAALGLDREERDRRQCRR